MNIFIDTTATREYSLLSEKSIVWTLGSLDSRLVLYILGKLHGSTAPDGEEPVAEPTNGEKFFAQLTDFLRFGLKGAKDAVTKEPLDLPFEEVDIPYIGKRRAVAESFVLKLRPDYLVELGREIRRDNLLTDDERKKSSGLSQSSGTLG